MARIKPFKAVRPAREQVAAVASLPYDVVSTEEARELAAGNPNSFLHVVRSEIDLPETTDPYDPSVYQKARSNLDRLLADGVLIEDGEERLYVYRQIMGGHVQASVVACCHVDDYWSDVIKKHEHTRADKEEDRIRHVRATHANTGPVFLTYPARASIDAIVARTMNGEAEYDFTAPDGIRHTVWIIRDPADTESLVAEFAAIPALYVADGHHRSASAAKVGRALAAENAGHTGNEEYNFFLAAIFPAEQLQILDYNRVIKDICGMTPEEFLARVQERFDLTELDGGPFRPAAPRQFGMFIENRWYRLDVRDGSFDPKDPVASLDVAILQNLLLQPVLRIDDPRTDKRIHFVGGIRGLGELEKLVRSGSFKVAFALHPTSITELMRIADSGKVMPPKSTWFEPKLRSGLLVHRLG